MQVERAGEVLGAATSDILETMFFTVVENSKAPESWTEPTLAVDVKFHGEERSGWFHLRMPQSCANIMAANFTGAVDPTEVTPDETEAVICELANMICGSTLSRLAPMEIFELYVPQAFRPEEGDKNPACPNAVQEWLRTEDGPLGLCWQWEDAA